MTQKFLPDSEYHYFQHVYPHLSVEEPDDVVRARVWARIEGKVLEKRGRFWHWFRSWWVITPALSLSTVMLLGGLFFQVYFITQHKAQLNQHLSSIFLTTNAGDWIYEYGDF